jgi:tRNA pseudouridine38-40 synthase
VVSFECGESCLDRPSGIARIIGPELAVLEASMAPDGFNARFSAIWRRYRYLIDTRPAADPLTRHFVWHVGRPLDTVAVEAASGAFIGEHDFSSFCRSAEARSNVRRVTDLSLVEDQGRLGLWVQANAFCHQMVRSIVGYLYDVGRGFSDGGAVESVIAAKDRSLVATVAPPHGLTLWAVGYD